MDIKHVLTELSQHPDGTFLEIQAFNQQSFGACKITGTSPVWEMHPDTDEFFHILEGEFEITLLDGDRPSHHIIAAGSIFVIPKGIWHKPSAPSGAQFMYFTPGQTLHSTSDNPRLDS